MCLWIFGHCRYKKKFKIKLTNIFMNLLYVPGNNSIVFIVIFELIQIFTFPEKLSRTNA